MKDRWADVKIKILRNNNTTQDMQCCVRSNTGTNHAPNGRGINSRVDIEAHRPAGGYELKRKENSTRKIASSSEKFKEQLSTVEQLLEGVCIVLSFSSYLLVTGQFDEKEARRYACLAVDLTKPHYDIGTSTVQGCPLAEGLYQV